MASGTHAKRKRENDRRKAVKRKERNGGKSAHRVKRDTFDPATPLPSVLIPPAIIKDIMAKKELLVSAELTEHVVLRYLRKKPELVEKILEPGFMRTAAYEPLKKWARQELRVLVGMFVFEHDLRKLIDSPTDVILANHRSTKERLQYYSDLYPALLGEKMPEAILDLCCGINPVSYEYLGCTPVYHAVDVSPELMDFVQLFFEKKGILGSARAMDVTNIAELPDADTVFIFKGTDVLERLKYGFSDKLLDKLFEKPRRVIVSFATATIGGNREIKLSKRSWVERWAEKNGRSVRIHDIPGERFYILE